MEHALKMKLYHVTLKRNMPSIMKRGLIPRKTKWEPNKDVRAVYFWSSLDLSKTLCNDQEVIIEATIPDGIRIDKLWNGAWKV